MCRCFTSNIYTTGQKRRPGSQGGVLPKWRTLTDGSGYYLPHSETGKLSVGDNCLLEKAFEIILSQQRTYNEEQRLAPQ